jgi:hypothetical protein
VAKQEQHLTTARLSAFIDGQLSPEEQRQTEIHLQDCAVCQLQLAELRQTVALLHALPQPPLPRSFVLPTAEPVIASLQTPRPLRPLAPIPPLPRRNRWPTYVTGAIRVASTLAALIGIVFLLSGLFGTLIPVGSSTTVSGAATTSGSRQGTQTLPNKPNVAGTTYQGMTPTPTKQPSVTRPKAGTTPIVQQNPLQAFLDVRLIGIRAILGTILLALGVIGFIVLARRM